MGGLLVALVSLLQQQHTAKAFVLHFPPPRAATAARWSSTSPVTATVSRRPTLPVSSRRFAALDREEEEEDDDDEEGLMPMDMSFPGMGGGGGGKKKSKPKVPKAPPRGPTGVALLPETPVEVWRAGQVTFGNYAGRPKKASIRVRLEHGEVVTVDVGQVTGVWAEGTPVPDHHAEDANSFLVASAPPPSTPESWAALRLRAAKAMKSLTPRALSLEAFWSLAMLRWKRDKAPVDSHHLAAFLFHRAEYEDSLKREQQHRAKELQEATSESEAPTTQSCSSSLQLPRVTSAQRYAAAILLASETFRFKRSVPTASAMPEEGQADEALVVTGQGFKPLEQSVVHSREVLSFVQAVRNMEEKRRLMVAEGEEDEEEEEEEGRRDEAGKEGSAQWDASQWRMLHHLEVFALGAGVEGLSATSKQVLKALEEEATPEGAKSVLLRAGYWTEKKGGGRGISIGGGARRPEDDSVGAAAASMSVATPWPEEILEVARSVLDKTQKRRVALSKVATPNRPGRKGPHGRHDYREAGLAAYALDPPGSEFADDALSFDPETGEVLIHIADVQSMLETAPELEALARQRGEALYLPDGPLHLLPPLALQAASLSDREVNECVTVAATLDKDGAVANVRLLLTLVPPITRIRYDEANELLATPLDKVPTYRRKAAEDLAVLLRASDARRALTKRSFSEGKRVSRVKRNNEGELEAISFQRTPAHLMVDEFLALYSEAGRRFLKAHAVTLPLSPGSVSGGLDAARFGTGPLRRYTDVLVQHQVISVLKGHPPLSKAEVIARMTQVNWQTKASQKLRSTSRSKVLLETFATYCASKAKAAGLPYAVVTAKATGTGTEVLLPDAGLKSYVRLPGDWKKKGASAKPRRLFDLEAGKAFEVHVLRVDPSRGTIDLEFADETDAVGVSIQHEEMDG